MNNFARPGETSNGAVAVSGSEIIAGTHAGPVYVREGASLDIRGTLDGPLVVVGLCTISGTVNGAVSTYGEGEILTNPGSVINGASHGTVGLGDLHGAS